MGDVWSNVGGSVASEADGWLYQKDGQVRGPLSKSALTDRLLRGEISPKTPVARQGGDFHPLSQVAAFEDDLELYAAARRKATGKRNRNILLLSVVVLLGAGGALGVYMKKDLDRREAVRQALARKDEAQRKVERAKMQQLLNKDVKLVALVSFDAEKIEVGNKSGSTKKPRRPGRKPRSGRNQPEPDQMVSQCMRKPKAILGVLGRHVSKLNVCVEDEKSRGAGSMPSSLVLDFIVTADGKIVEFSIRDRHYRTGPMRNCMLKVFRQVRYPSVGGTNCPVAIPMKIGG